jgi:hypothetical protein
VWIHIDGNDAKWLIGGAAGFAKGDLSDRSGQVDQDSQTAMVYLREVCQRCLY